MANDHDATSYTANGPTDIGFRTHGTRITKGVEAFGTAIGVHGIGTGIEGSTAESIGVLGEGIGGYGVKGHSDNFPGVYGQSEKQSGVRGTGATGVEGKANGLHGVFGVHGSCFNNKDFTGVGVKGENDKGAGVEGESIIATGVLGGSKIGWGVHGRSAGSYGGVFTSNFAQIRLEPAALADGPPEETQHKKGEFFVDGRGALYYCYSDAPPKWKKLAGVSKFELLITRLVTLIGSIFKP
jgi:hypothetical protein